MGGKSITRFNRTVTLWKSKKIREIARGSRKNVFVPTDAKKNGNS